MSSKQAYRLLITLTFTVVLSTGQSQTLKQEKMNQLNYMVGEWVGTSSSFENGVKTKEVPAYEKISYDLDKHILVIELKSESLQLHTIIYYDEQDSAYYYNPFSKRGARKLPAKFKDGQLVVSSGSDRRFIFRSPGENQFQEYGEQLVNGQWVRYFEDNFRNVE